MIPRPHSGDDFNEIEQQRSIIERMDEETVNDKFEEMLVSRVTIILCRRVTYKVISTVVVLGEHESHRGEEGTFAAAIGNKKERNVGPALQRQRSRK